MYETAVTVWSKLPHICGECTHSQVLALLSTSEAPVVESGWCAKSYHDSPFIRDRACNQSSISEHSPLLGATGILVEEYLALWYWLIFLYICYV